MWVYYSVSGIRGYNAQLVSALETQPPSSHNSFFFSPPLKEYVLFFPLQTLWIAQTGLKNNWVCQLREACERLAPPPLPPPLPPPCLSPQEPEPWTSFPLPAASPPAAVRGPERCVGVDFSGFPRLHRRRREQTQA